MALDVSVAVFGLAVVLWCGAVGAYLSLLYAYGERTQWRA